MKPLEFTYTVKSTDVDMYRRIGLSSLFRLLQEAAISHTIAIGVGRDKTLDRGLLWVVTQQQADVTRLPEYDETITVSTWPGKSMHLFFPRFWRISDMSGQALIEASSYWVLMEETTRKIAFPEKHGIRIDEYPDPLNSRLPRRLRLDGGAFLGNFTVPYSYTDLNGHMNNARYFDLAQDYMPVSMRGRTPARVSAEYIGEASIDETISLTGDSSEDHFHLVGSVQKPIFQVQLLFSDRQ